MLHFSHYNVAFGQVIVDNFAG